MKTTNVGVVKALFVGLSAPSNNEVIWLDTSLTIPLHKFYNVTTSTWVPFINAVLVDNVSIKIDGDGKIYVDTSIISPTTIADGSVTLAKLANMATGSLYYRKTVGTGVPEVQTLAVLKTDLGLVGNNTGDQDLSLYVLRVTTVNGKALSGNITLTPEDIGSPSGSGTSTGDNTGDETEASILALLGKAALYSQVESDSRFVAIVSGSSLITDTEKTRLLTVKGNPYQINMPVGDLATKIAGASFVPTGWATVSLSGSTDILVTHTLTGRKISFVNVFEIDGDNADLLSFDKGTAYTGVTGSESTDTLIIKGIAPSPSVLPLKVKLIFD